MVGSERGFGRLPRRMTRQGLSGQLLKVLPALPAGSLFFPKPHCRAGGVKKGPSSMLSIRPSTAPGKRFSGVRLSGQALGGHDLKAFLSAACHV